MSGPAKRLYFIDAMRAWAILMMLQGHFIDGLLDPLYRDPENSIYNLWKYFRGITAPVFFTMSGFIFTFLLLRVPGRAFDNPRVKKGIRRGLQLVIIGYLLRLNLLGLFKGQLYPSFFLVDVLHCIGISLLVIIAFYLLSNFSGKWLFSLSLLGATLLLFLFEPVYKTWGLENWPDALANYLSKKNGSVFTIIPWVGYAMLGGFLATVFHPLKDRKYFYLKAIAICVILGIGLIGYSSVFFSYLGRSTGIELFNQIVSNNYLFIRLGDVFIVCAIFIILRRFMEKRLLLRIGQNTLSIYVIHFILLYGSFTGLGLYKFYHHTLTPVPAIIGAVLFMIVCTALALIYESNWEFRIKAWLSGLWKNKK